MPIEMKPASGASVPILSFAELNASPHETYRSFRDRFPFVRREDGVFIVLRADDVQLLSGDTLTRQVEKETMAARGAPDGPIMDFVSNSMLYSNGGVHRRRRQPLARSFAYRMTADLRPKIRELAEDLLASAAEQGRMTLRGDFAALLPAITIAGILGIPRSDAPLFSGLAYEMARLLTTSWTAQDLPAIEAATRGLTEYAADLIADRRRNPKDDFLSDYVAQVDKTTDMSALEAVMQIVSVVLAGSETTQTAIVIQTGLLLERPSLWRAVCKNPDLIGPAVAESLRYEPPVASIPRLGLQDIVLDGQVIPKGHPILLCTLSSMRDPGLFANPDTFDLQRDRPRWHPVFGQGAHRCLGEFLARVELEEALAALTPFAPHLDLGNQRLVVHGHAGIRKVDEIEVCWR